MIFRLFEERTFQVPNHPFFSIWITDPWPIFLAVIPLLTVLFIGLSIYLLHPVRPKPNWWKRLRTGQTR